MPTTHLYRCPSCRHEAERSEFFTVVGDVCPKCNNFVTAIPTKPKKPFPSRTGSKLKPMSDKRKKLMADVGPERKAFLNRVSFCMVCGRRKPLDAHEIANGPAREKCLNKFRLVMALCRSCHDAVGTMPKAKQLCLRICVWELGQARCELNELLGTAQTHITPASVLAYLSEFKTKGAK